MMAQTGPRAEGACAACGAVRLRPLYRWTGGRLLRRCDACALIDTYPLPSAAELTRLYGGHGEPECAGHGHMRRRTDLERRLALVRVAVGRYLELCSEISARPPRTLLDAGGGIGIYSKAAELLGVEATCVEIDAGSVAFARDELGLTRVVEADVRAMAAEIAGSFDVVLARHTIEHLVDPNSFVAALSGLVRPRGVTIIETPKSCNWEQWAHPATFPITWKTLRQENPELSVLRGLLEALRKPLSAAAPPKHLYGFDRASLGILLERHGLVPRRWFVAAAGDATFDPLFFLDAADSRTPLGLLYDRYERAASRLVGRLGGGSRLAVFAERVHPAGAR